MDRIHGVGDEVQLGDMGNDDALKADGGWTARNGA